MDALDRFTHFDKSISSSRDETIESDNMSNGGVAETFCPLSPTFISAFVEIGVLILMKASSLQLLMLSVLKRGQILARPDSTSSIPSPLNKGQELISRTSNEGQNDSGSSA
eukprot:CAMPEP_0196178848 /NCGR_PEP_ID=MMETSP0911-20130528/18585_1 /TAXON_ID=49265 /ORGANISM="Thalassiosira rotula, Strain GSO102" /LENGTH=110 /DNA_ID=CAMNT_0041447405 /DNA_START=277 /DNA_END=609 /DNA_ORIENTATION=-